MDNAQHQNTQPASLLLLGGTGKAGRRIAAFLAPRITGRITIAGRDRNRADYWSGRLREDCPGGASFDATSTDVEDPESLAEAVAGHDLVILSAPMDLACMDRLIDAVTDTGADCVELSPIPGKHGLFERRSEDIRKSRSRFVLDAGADPGLPGWAARSVLGQAESPRALEVYARYRDADLGAAGAADILREASEDPLVYRDGWRKAGLLDWRLPVFPGRLGRSLSVPLRLPELMSLPDQYDLDYLALYHAGINPVCDLIVLCARLGMNRPLGTQRLRRWFSAAARRLTFGAKGLGIVAKASGSAGSRQVTLSHGNVYEATAAVAGLASLHLAGSERGGGRWAFAGEWLDDPLTPDRLRAAGFSVDCG